MRSIWAVARQTFTECSRRKVAAVSIALLVVLLGGLPFYAVGDGTLSGRIRTQLDYSTIMITVLLGVVTLILSVSVVCDDVSTKRIFLVAAKPIHRWQYILGRWVGVVVFLALLVAAACILSYGLAQYLRGQQTNPDDRRTIETEVFAARARVSPESLEPRVQQYIRQRIESMGPQRYEEAVKAFLGSSEGGSLAAAEQALQKELRKQALQALQSVPPSAPPGGRPLVWRFQGVNVAGAEVRAAAEVVAIHPNDPLIRFRVDPLLVGQMSFGGPVRVEGVDARIYDLGRDTVDVMFLRPDDMKRGAVAGLKPGRDATLVVEPMIQITYKPVPQGDAPGGVLFSEWQVINPKTNEVYYENRNDPVRLPATLSVPGRVVSEDGEVVVVYYNRVSPGTGAGTSVKMAWEDMAVLYRVGGFEWNFVRGGLMILIQMMFLAGVGILTGSFLSFSVAFVVSLLVLPLGLMRGFLTDAVRVPTDAFGGVEGAGETLERVGLVLANYMVRLVNAVLPDFSSAMPGDSLVDGMLISWSQLGAVSLYAVGVRVTIALGVACLVFRKRELARVQV